MAGVWECADLLFLYIYDTFRRAFVVYEYPKQRDFLTTWHLVVLPSFQVTWTPRVVRLHQDLPSLPELVPAVKPWLLKYKLESTYQSFLYPSQASICRVTHTCGIENFITSNRSLPNSLLCIKQFRWGKLTLDKNFRLYVCLTSISYEWAGIVTSNRSWVPPKNVYKNPSPYILITN